MAFAALFIPGFGVADAYAKTPAAEFSSAVGIFLASWFIVTFIFL